MADPNFDTASRYFDHGVNLRELRPGNRVVVLGASIENLQSFRTATNESFGYDWPTYAMLLSGGRFNLIQNMAIGGQTTDQFIARFATDVAPYSPNVVCLGSIENDIQAQTTVAHQHANIKQLTAMCRAIGAVPVWRSSMPHSTLAVHAPTAAYNAWLRRYCSQEGLPFLDFWSVVVDPTTGLYKAPLTVEGVHPNEQGHFLLAQYWLAQMANYLPPNSIQRPQDTNDTGQLCATPLFSTNVSGTPTSWNAVSGTPAGTARTMVADPNGYGNMVRHTHTASSSAITTQNNSADITTTKVSAGDLLSISGVYTSDGGVNAAIAVTMTTDGTSPSQSRVPISNLKWAISQGTYKQEMIVPAGILRVQVALSSGPGTGVVDFGYPVVRNLTREGGDPI